MRLQCIFRVDVDGVSDCCGKPTEGNTYYCATHSRLMRKAEEQANRDAEKLAAKALKAKHPVKRTPIAKQSDKMKDDLKVYRICRLNYLSRYPDCQLRLPGCDGIATDIHHCAGRGINLNNVSTWKSACRECHSKLHDELSSEEARELGLKVSAINQERTDKI